MHVLMIVNSAWNIWNFRRPLINTLIAEGHLVTVLAPPDESVEKLEQWGCRIVPLEMNVKGLNPMQDLWLMRRFKRHFQDENPDLVLSYTIKNNIFGAMSANACSIPFIPNVTGLGTAFLSGGFLQTVAKGLYSRAFSPLPLIFFQKPDDRDLFVARKIVRSTQAQLLPGSGIDVSRFAVSPLPPTSAPLYF